ncbi:MAG: plasmid stabilization protein, partial [Nitrospirales bacterium]|nr:plasmid stabilization protein [Nitrospirales bacterium]
FTRSAKKFIEHHPVLKSELARALKSLEQDPAQPHLRLYPLKGNLKGLHAVSITYKYRITLTLAMTEKEITLLDIGSHDEGYRAS